MNEKSEHEAGLAEQPTRIGGVNAPMFPQCGVQVIDTPDQSGLRQTPANPNSIGKTRSALGASTPFPQVKKQDLRLFKTLAARCAVSVKSKYSDMGDCHSASAALAKVLRSRGFDDATVIGCSVLTGSCDDLTSRMGEFDSVDEGAHSIVMVGGCLIDTTSGQFRDDQIQIPDYLVLPGRIAIPMLVANRRWMETKDEGLVTYSVGNGAHNFLIAYIPTDPSFNLG